MRVIEDGVVQTTPFMDISGDHARDGERARAAVGRLRARLRDLGHASTSYLTAQDPTARIQVWEYRRSAEPERRGRASGRLLLTIPHNQASQPQRRPAPVRAGRASSGWHGRRRRLQQPVRARAEPDSRLGKLLRLDVADGAVEQLASACATRGGSRSTRTGRIVIADVGQNAVEEINVGLAANYGWPCCEGTHDVPPTDPGCATARPPSPVLEKTHGGANDGFCSITGGYVVRDPGLPTLLGRYIYGDYCDARAALGRPRRRRPPTRAIGINVAGLSVLRRGRLRPPARRLA